jgi:hypothetical protein
MLGDDFMVDLVATSQGSGGTMFSERRGNAGVVVMVGTFNHASWGCNEYIGFTFDGDRLLGPGVSGQFSMMVLFLRPLRGCRVCISSSQSHQIAA